MKKDPLRIQAHFLLGFLVVQYLLGMAANLFVQFPDTKKPGVLWEFAKQQAFIYYHLILAGLLLIGGIVFLIRAIFRKDKNWLISSILGLLSMIGATVGGVLFVSTQQDGYSYLMATMFILAFFAYGWGIYKGKKASS